MSTSNDPWIVVSGAGGFLGRAIVSHFAAKGSSVLALDRKFYTELPPGVTGRNVDLLVEKNVHQALDGAIPPTQSIGLLINAVGLIWNEPTLALRGTKLAPHGLDSWRTVLDANLTAPFVVATQVAA